ncbi:MAG: transposase [Rickettsia endosymbiont of Ixodes persulcatus]|nr:transposase [Rickettsia endosymbiont of Ixodes persulcatus]
MPEKKEEIKEEKPKEEEKKQAEEKKEEITAKKMFEKFPDLKNKLWGTEFWTNGYFMSMVGKHRDEKKITQLCKESRCGSTII